MKNISLLIALCLTGWACTDDGGTEREYRAPESFVPEEVREQFQSLEDPLAKACAAHQFILATRLAECGGPEWGQSSQSPADRVDNCRRNIDAAHANPTYIETLENCLDHLANASCSQLEGEGGQAACVLVEEW